tara:strand:- start:2894 stop:3100 length:207 start_codon:yes stop_codon:yes gene_type:complete
MTYDSNINSINYNNPTSTKLQNLNNTPDKFVKPDKLSFVKIAIIDKGRDYTLVYNNKGLLIPDNTNKN